MNGKVEASLAALKVDNKIELMGKLWLQNEVKALESEAKGKPVVNFTPFLVIDALALTDHSTIVKALIKTNKFVVLVPSVGKKISLNNVIVLKLKYFFFRSSVLTELDAMKKSREDARNATRWLESEFSKGSRFLRMQRSYETLAIPMLKAPRKFGTHFF